MPLDLCVAASISANDFNRSRAATIGSLQSVSEGANPIWEVTHSNRGHRITALSDAYNTWSRAHDSLGRVVQAIDRTYIHHSCGRKGTTKSNQSPKNLQRQEELLWIKIFVIMSLIGLSCDERRRIDLPRDEALVWLRIASSPLPSNVRPEDYRFDGCGWDESTGIRAIGAITPLIHHQSWAPDPRVSMKQVVERLELDGGLNCRGGMTLEEYEKLLTMVFYLYATDQTLHAFKAVRRLPIEE